MEVAFDLKDAGLVIGFCLLVSVSVYLIIMLWNISKFVKRLNMLAEKNAVHIDATLTLLPLIALNVNEAAMGVRQSFATVGSAVESLDGSLQETVTAMNNGTENIMNLISAAGTVIGNIIHSIKSRRRR